MTHCYLPEHSLEMYAISVFDSAIKYASKAHIGNHQLSLSHVAMYNEGISVNRCFSGICRVRTILHEGFIQRQRTCVAVGSLSEGVAVLD